VLGVQALLDPGLELAVLLLQGDIGVTQLLQGIVEPQRPAVDDMAGDAGRQQVVIAGGDHDLRRIVTGEDDQADDIRVVILYVGDLVMGDAADLAVVTVGINHPAQQGCTAGVVASLNEGEYP